MAQHQDSRSPSTSSARTVLLVLVVAMLFTVSYSFVLECQPLSSETLEGFYKFISESSGYADVCPFVIRGEAACQTSSKAYSKGYVVSNKENIYISCDPYRREARCIVDCPVQRHFTVSSGASLTLESMVLSGAEASAVYIEPQGQLAVFDSGFHDNHSTGSGGAIYASTATNLQVRFSDFESNRAKIGGAIFSMGETTIFRSIFYGNVAAAGGGAVAVNTADAKLEIGGSTFELNEAANGGAVFVEEYARSFISYTTLQRNIAFSGGAIENFGTVEITDSSFLDNFADVGGAINTGPGSSTNLRRNKFMNNSAANIGPAVYDRYRSNIFERDNTACGNSLTDKEQQCDGVLTRISLRRVRCRPFATECSAPMQQPIIPPSETPTFSPSFLPSQSPSIIPTFLPSVISTPSTFSSTESSTIKPPGSLEPAKSDEPTLIRTYIPSDSGIPLTSLTPSFPASIITNDEPSLSTQPSTVDTSSSDAPSFSPSLSIQPSGMPTDIAKISPHVSERHTQSLVPTSSLIPSDRPSLAPSNTPSYSTFS
ncbi:POMP domain polymorphic outer membrane protein [Nitzschia inconspicua]|uniref:POMP domain polymorphic outer membrane protein n=1 Tax=Nitzschia inconspicua TaxID=303405 RepID=A0A9K3PIK2_9STRA|nr:POMP domain polymorphic outer membrane protein [Nitzschia inconspicua]